MVSAGLDQATTFWSSGTGHINVGGRNSQTAQGQGAKEYQRFGADAAPGDPLGLVGPLYAVIRQSTKTAAHFGGVVLECFLLLMLNGALAYCLHLTVLYLLLHTSPTSFFLMAPVRDLFFMAMSSASAPVAVTTSASAVGTTAASGVVAGAGAGGYAASGVVAGAAFVGGGAGLSVAGLAGANLISITGFTAAFLGVAVYVFVRCNASYFSQGQGQGSNEPSANANRVDAFGSKMMDLAKQAWLQLMQPGTAESFTFTAEGGSSSASGVWFYVGLMALGAALQFLVHVALGYM